MGDSQGDNKRYCVTLGERSKIISVKVPVCFLAVKSKIKDKFALEESFTIQCKLEEFNRFINVEDEDDVDLLTEAKEILVHVDAHTNIENFSPIPLAPSDRHLHSSTPSPGLHVNVSTRTDTRTGTRRTLIQEDTSTSSTDQEFQRVNGEKVFNVRTLMNKHPRGRPIDTEYEKNGTMTTQSRCELVQIVVANLVERFTYYPDENAKLAAAKAIVQAYPNLKKKGSEFGHENFFSTAGGRQSGYIQSKLKNIRRALNDDAKQRPRKKKPENEPDRLDHTAPVAANTTQNNRKRPRQDDCIPDAAAEELTLLAKRTSLDKVEEIKSAMKETFANRQKWIFEKAPFVSEIVEKYPRYKDVPQLVDYDFNFLFGEEKGKQLITKWETRFVDGVIRLARMSKSSKVKELLEELDKPMEFEEDEEYQPSADEKSMYAFLLLVNLLPTHATKKKGRVSSLQSMNFLIDFKPVGMSVEHHLKTKDKERSQPYVLCIGTRDNPRQFFVVVDGLAIPCPDNITSAIDRLFKVHYAFNLEYHAALNNFFTFLELVVYDIKDRKHGIPAIVLELESSMDAVTKQPSA